MNKQIIREKMRKIREELSSENKSSKSLIILKNFLKLPEVKESKVIMSYLDIKNEVETLKLNEELKKLGKTILLPKIKNFEIEVYKDTGEYKKNKFGILEPYQEKYLGKIDLIIVPGIVFNSRGDRIGFGKGYYDKFLAKSKHKNSKKISIIYAFQIFENFDGENFDQKVDILVTENNVFKNTKY